MKRRAIISRSAAFTLIELLAVIAVIMLLAALLLPALSRARSQAHAASCASRLKQMGVGLTLYASEEGYFPIMDYRDPFGGGFASVTWCEMIYPYFAGGPPPTSPSMVSDIFTDPAVQDKRGAWNRPFALTYTINANRGTAGFTGIAGEPTNGMTMAQMEALRVPFSLVPEPSRTFAVVDGRKSPYTFLEANTHFVRNAGEMSLNPHDGYNNWLFCDGHVERLLASTTYGSNGTPTNCKGIWSRTQGD